MGVVISGLAFLTQVLHLAAVLWQADVCHKFFSADLCWCIQLAALFTYRKSSVVIIVVAAL